MSKKLKMILMPIVLVLLFSVVSYFLFFKDSNLFNKDKSPEVRRLNGFPTVIYTSKDIEKKRVVIRNQEELATFLNEIDESGSLLVRENINFNKEIVVAVSTATNDEEGVELKIKKIYENKEKNKLLVSVRETKYEKDCEKVINKNVALDLVVIEDTKKNIEFERITNYTKCEVTND